ncbi:MAG: ubiquinol-cytochrome c reductase iron-sulfur subunit [Acidimicrobiia bacterium]|nr:ubiquinol-cytochrome c reductase iron-sulfur subunit [Acidimicrobiia bacterium]
MNNRMNRREVLVRAWQAGAALVAGAGVWTTWDLLRPAKNSGLGGLIRTVPPEAVGDTGAVEVLAARAFLVRIDGEIVALSETCTHLGCRVPFCESSNRFECPCHGSVFNRAGELISGPSPRGLDRHPVEVGEDGLLYIDTESKTPGVAPGTFTIDEPSTGPSCATESDH